MRGLPPVSVVIPAYNERVRLPGALASIECYLTEAGAEYEIVVVDDGSSDGTADAVETLQAAHPRLRFIRLTTNRGKGGAVRAGMEAAAGEYILFTDADQSTSIDQLSALMRPLLGSYDIAIGSRGAEGATIVRSQRWFRQTLGKVGGNLAKLLLVWGYRESQCGFKCFRRDIASDIFPRLTTSTALFDLEVLLLAARRGYRVAEVPVSWKHDPDSRITYNFTRTVAAFREVLRLRRHWRVGLPEKVDVTMISRVEPPAEVGATADGGEHEQYPSDKVVL